MHVLMSYAIHMIYYIYNRGCDMHVLMSYAIHMSYIIYITVAVICMS